MTLNLPLLYWFWFVEYCQTSPNKKEITKLWTRNKHLTLLYFWLRIIILDHNSGFKLFYFWQWSLSKKFWVSGAFSKRFLELWFCKFLFLFVIWSHYFFVQFFVRVKHFKDLNLPCSYFVLTWSRTCLSLVNYYETYKVMT